MEDKKELEAQKIKEADAKAKAHKAAETKAKKEAEAQAKADASPCAKIGKKTLADNPKMTEVFVTSDGVPFFGKCDADNHARTLEDNAVYHLKNNKCKQ